MQLPPPVLGSGGEVSLSILELALVWPGHQRVDGAERRQSFLPDSRGFRNKKDMLLVVGFLGAFKIKQQGNELPHSERGSPNLI